MRRFFLSVITFLVILLIFAMPSFAEVDRKAIYDRAEIFSEEEIEALEKSAKQYFGDLYASVYIVTDDSNNVSYYGEHFKAEYKIPEDSVILIITANKWHNYDIYTYGKCYYKISNAEIDNILDADDVYGNIKNGRYFEGATSFIQLSAAACQTNYFSIVVLTVTLTAISGLIVVLSVVYNYKRKSRSDKYPLNRYCRLDLTVQRDDFRGTFVTQRRIQTGSGRGGRSGRGGGSGHRGGR